MSDQPFLEYQALLNALPEQYLVLRPDDPDFTIVAANKARAETSLMQPQDIIGKPLLKALPELSRKSRKTNADELIGSLRRVVKSSKPDVMPTLRFDRPKGDGSTTVNYWQVTHYPIFDQKGKLSLIFQVTKDITDKITTSTKLERTTRQLQEALSAGLIGTWVWDIPINKVVTDKYLASMFGVTPEKAAEGLPVEVFIQSIHPDDRQMIEDKVADTLQSKKFYEAEYRTIDSEGKIRWLIAKGRIERDKQGQPIRFPGVIIDNTERKQTENNLKFLAQASSILSSSLDYKQTLDSIARLIVPERADWCAIDMLDAGGSLELAVVVHEDPGKVKLAHQLRETYGAPRMDAPSGVTKVISTGKSEYYREIPDDLLAASANNEKHLDMLRELGLSSAIIVPLKIMNKPVGALTMIMAGPNRHYQRVDLDIAEELARRASMAMTNAYHYEQAQRELAERTRLEEALRQANEDLEKRVVERTIELNESNANLQRSNQELQDFAYVASHDLQEPLRKIQAFGNLLQDEYGEQLGEGRDYLERMRAAAKRMSALIEDILSFSRVTTKAREFTRTDLNIIAAEVLEDLETRINETKATVEIGKLPIIKADPTQMRQLLQNLISNALKFHKPDVPPRIKVSAVTEISQSSKKRYTTIRVEDNGVGFDEKYLDRIFAVFQRLHTRDSYEGTGIGLAVCRKIVERHGGTITAESKPGEGSSFVIVLPMHHKKGEAV